MMHVVCVVWCVCVCGLERKTKRRSIKNCMCGLERKTKRRSIENCKKKRKQRERDTHTHTHTHTHIHTHPCFQRDTTGSVFLSTPSILVRAAMCHGAHTKKNSKKREKREKRETHTHTHTHTYIHTHTNFPERDSQVTVSL